MRPGTPMIGLLLLAVQGCAEILRDDTLPPLEPWRAATILGENPDFDLTRTQGPIPGAAQSTRTQPGTVYPGGSPLVQQAVVRTDDRVGGVTLNLVDVTIAQAAEAILGGLFNENFVVDPSLNGTINIRSTRPIGRKTALEVFELSLKQNGAALVQRNDIYAIVPIAEARTIAGTTSPTIQPGYSLRVVPLEHIGAREMATILQPTAGDSVVGVDEQRNVIVLAGTSSEQRAWQNTISSFDVDWLANRSVGIFPVRGRSARSIIRGLELIVDAQEGSQPIAFFEVIPESNSILAVARTPAALRSVAQWVHRLTREGQNDAQVYSYEMRYAKAGDIAPILAEILGIEVQIPTSGAEAQPGAGAALNPVAAAQAAFAPQLAAAPALLDDPSAAGGFEASGDPDNPNATRIVASEPTNTLLIHAIPAEYERILGVLERLDVPRRQVLVEATIIEVTLNDELRYGVQYFFEREGSDFILDADISPGIAPFFPGFNALINSPVNVIVDALDDLTTVNIISSPNLMILNNQSARLNVGDQVPVAQRTAQDVFEDNDGIFTSEIEYRDTGIIFDVTPRINSSGSVLLDIRQEVSLVGAEDAETLTPTISQRVIESSIAVNSGETIALGGLFSTQDTRGRSGIPLLVDIPVAGNLFGRTTSARVRTELLVLITPRIVNNFLDARRVTRGLRERVTTLQLDDATLSTQIATPELETQNSLMLDRNARLPVTATPDTAGEPEAVTPSTVLPAPTPGSSKIESSELTRPVAPVLTPGESPSVPAPQEAAAAPPSPPPSPVSPPSTGGSHYVMLGTFRDPAGPERLWREVSARDGATLSGLEPDYSSQNGLNQIRLGPFPKAEAAALCNRLQSACYVSGGAG